MSKQIMNTNDCREIGKMHKNVLLRIFLTGGCDLCIKGALEKQDHQRWGYSTVIHLEKTIYLAIWKDLNKEKRKEQ